MTKLFTILGIVLLQSGNPAYSPLSEVFKEDPLLATGNYRAPVLDAPAPTKAPKGYKVFHISSYTRHGARNFSRNAVYDSVKDVLEAGRLQGKLTADGERFLEIYREIYDRSIGGNSDLTEIGAEQHRALAARMMKDYPQVFRGRKQVEARSTTAPRCILSMANFCGSLHDCDSRLDIRMQASPKDMAALNPNSSYNPRLQEDLAENVMESPKAPYWEEYKQMWRKKTDPKAYFCRLFTDWDWFLAQVGDEYEMLKNFYYMSGIEQCCTGRHELMTFATPEEMCAMFECENLRFFGVSGNHDWYQGRNWALCESLLRDILDYARKDIRSDSEVAARLRFGHDFRLASLLTLLQVDGFDRKAANADEAADVFRFYESPMAANLLFVFYRNREGEVLVRLSLNGSDRRLPIEAYEGCFYRWKDFSSWCEERLQEADRILRQYPFRPMVHQLQKTTPKVKHIDNQAK